MNIVNKNWQVEYNYPIKVHKDMVKIQIDVQKDLSKQFQSVEIKLLYKKEHVKKMFASEIKSHSTEFQEEFNSYSRDRMLMSFQFLTFKVEWAATFLCRKLK